MLKELAKNDAEWRQIALMITKGNKVNADDLVNEMYLRRHDNDRGQPITEYYILLTMKSIYLNQKKANRLVIVEDLIIDTREDEQYEIDDNDKAILDRYKELDSEGKELLELSYDHSLREIQSELGINYVKAHYVINEARKKVLQERIGEYNNKRLKHRKMKSRGFGDTIEKITKALGIKKVIDMMGKDCGCEERKEYLNRIFGYRLTPRCFTSDELEMYGDFVRQRTFRVDKGNKATGEIKDKDIRFVVDMYNSIFSMIVKYPECRGCAGSAKMVIDMVTKLDTVYLNNIPSDNKKKKVSINDVNNLQD